MMFERPLGLSQSQWDKRQCCCKECSGALRKSLKINKLKIKPARKHIKLGLGKQIKSCAVCGKEFEKPVNLSQARWEEKHCCSRDCSKGYRKGDTFAKEIGNAVKNTPPARPVKKLDLKNIENLQCCIKCGEKMSGSRISALCEECEKEEQYERDNP